MTSRDFCYWLQGHFEIAEPKTLGEKETLMIKKHLALVFKHEIDPSMGDENHQLELNNIHNKPTLEQLGEEHGFSVNTNVNPLHGHQPHPNWEYNSLHGWYDPKIGVPRC